MLRWCYQTVLLQREQQWEHQTPEASLLPQTLPVPVEPLGWTRTKSRWPVLVRRPGLLGQLRQTRILPPKELVYCRTLPCWYSQESVTQLTKGIKVNNVERNAAVAVVVIVVFVVVVASGSVVGSVCLIPCRSERPSNRPINHPHHEVRTAACIAAETETLREIRPMSAHILSSHRHTGTDRHTDTPARIPTSIHIYIHARTQTDCDSEETTMARTSGSNPHSSSATAPASVPANVPSSGRNTPAVDSVKSASSASSSAAMSHHNDSPSNDQQQQKDPSNNRLVDTTGCVPIVYGSVAFFLDKKADEYHTHKWTLYVRGPNHEDLSLCIAKVVFHLHPSFAQPVRELAEPPFEVTERGWGEFEAQIRIIWKDSDEKATIVNHGIKLYPPGVTQQQQQQQLTKEPVVAETYDEVVFTDPKESFFQQLVKLREAPPVKSHDPTVQDCFGSFSDEDNFQRLLEAHKFLTRELNTVKENLKRISDETDQVDAAVKAIQETKKAIRSGSSSKNKASGDSVTSGSNKRQKTS